MSGAILVTGGLASLVVLVLGFAWVFKFLYGFFQPLDEPIRVDGLYRFEFAGGATGVMVWYIIVVGLAESGLLQ